MVQAEQHAHAKPVFVHPFTMCVSGCTGSGKTKWVLRLLANLDALVDPAHIDGVLYCFGEVNEDVLRLQLLESVGSTTTTTTSTNGAKKSSSSDGNSGRWVRVCHALPDEDGVKRAANECNCRLLLVLDDLMVGMRAPFLDTLFTRGSHNWGVSVVLITQHLFIRELRIARNNAHYLVLLRHPSGALQVRSLGVQLFPGALRHFLEAYDDATTDSFGYLLVDMHPTTRTQMRLKTHIYPGELTVVYAPRDRAAINSDRPETIQQEKRQQQQQQKQAKKRPKPSQYIQQNISFFKQLSNCRSARARAYRQLVRGASSEQLLCLVESALNILRERVPLRNTHLQHLRAQAQHVRALGRARSGHGARRLLLRQQTGRGVPALAGLVASVVLPLLADRLMSRKDSIIQT
ncbi:hypothetical protein niasHT_002841 [Heterodera trifolii]|uniref:AAA+ ATPase domain-containing protein n=1 Tax=Heterodera trifolii TaxID=157864 RepID=A0ABD2LQT3_9BILA